MVTDKDVRERASPERRGREGRRWEGRHSNCASLNFTVATGKFKAPTKRERSSREEERAPDGRCMKRKVSRQSACFHCVRFAARAFKLDDKEKAQENILAFLFILEGKRSL